MSVVSVAEAFASSAIVADVFVLLRERPVPRAALETRLRAAFPRDPNLAHLDGLLACALDGVALDPSCLVARGLDVVFAAQLLEWPSRVVHERGAMHVRPGPPVRRAGTDLDPIAKAHEAPVTLLMVVMVVALLTITPRRRLAVVASMRDEGWSLLEWVAHYRILGADALFVYTNDNVDGSERLLDALAQHGVVRLITNVLTPETVPQQKCYHHALLLLPELRDYAWAFFSDADEFFVPAAQYGYSLPALVSAAEEAVGPPLGAICLHWKWVGSGKAFARTPGLLMERFRQTYRNDHVKSVVRVADTVSMHVLHVPVLAPGRVAVTSSLAPCGQLAPQLPPDYAGGAVHHYWNKSFEEFVFKRMRGDGSRDASSAAKTFETFFTWGQKPRVPEPLDTTLADRLAAELGALRALPGVDDAVQYVETRSAAALADFDRRIGVRRLYDDLCGRA
jgi:Glycosyl transferase family 2